jgi:hypothetical protein
MHPLQRCLRQSATLHALSATHSETREHKDEQHNKQKEKEHSNSSNSLRE